MGGMRILRLAGQIGADARWGVRGAGWVASIHELGVRGGMGGTRIGVGGLTDHSRRFAVWMVRGSEPDTRASPI